jgi:hypothetical protein
LVTVAGNLLKFDCPQAKRCSNARSKAHIVATRMSIAVILTKWQPGVDLHRSRWFVQFEG